MTTDKKRDGPAPRARTIVTGGKVAGGTFALDAGDHVEPIWGEGTRVLWARGEQLMLFAPQGTGKTTLMQRVVLYRTGILGGPLLGFPVAMDARPFLYLAMDRPSQAARSLRRMVGEEQRDLLNKRLIVWKGPVPFNAAEHPEKLAVWIRDEFGAVGVAVDSLKDLAPGLSKDEVGSAINIAFQSCTAGGIEVITAHHPRKASAENKEPSTLDDVYGSTWLTAGAGSVVCIWGEAGDTVLRLKHLKQPEEPVGPFDIRVNHVTGQISRADASDALGILREAGAAGVTAEELAVRVRGGKEPADIKWAQRQLTAIEKRGLAARAPAAPEGGHGGAPARWFDPRSGTTLGRHSGTTPVLSAALPTT